MQTMRCAVAGVLTGAIVLGAVGCGDESNGGDYADSDEVVVPTPEEADAEAAAEIRDQNADEVFEQLDAEIDEELEGGG